MSLSSGVCYTVIFNSSVLRNFLGLVTLSAASLLVTSPEINWYWLEPGCLGVSNDYAFVLLAPRRQSRRALFYRVDSANHTLSACHSLKLSRTGHIVPLHYHVGMCLFYHPASYTDVAGSRQGDRSTAWGSCKPSELPRRLISPPGLLHHALSLYFHLSRIFDGKVLVRGQCSHCLLPTWLVGVLQQG